MDNSSNDNSSENDNDINPPPITELPSPDPFDTRNLKQGRNWFDKKTSKKKKKKKKKKRLHPLDTYKDVRRKKGSRGCCAGLGCLSLIFLITLAGSSYWLAKPFRNAFTLVWSIEPSITISEAPQKPTVYLFPLATVRYEAPTTSVPLGIFGKSVLVSGDFLDHLYLRGLDVTAESGTRCAKDLDIYAYRYNNNGVTVVGNIFGKTVR